MLTLQYKGFPLGIGIRQKYILCLFMIIPYTVAIGAAMCDMFGGTFPWAGISYENSWWVWVDRIDRPAIWISGKADIPQNVSNGYIWGMTKCGEISCLDSTKGLLYNDLCMKLQDVICQVNCKTMFLDLEYSFLWSCE
jgi:hypothetical protein